MTCARVGRVNVFEVAGSVGLPSPSRPALFHRSRAPLPSALAAGLNGTGESTLLGYLSHGAENSGRANPLRECVAGHSSAKALGQVPSSIEEKAVTSE